MARGAAPVGRLEELPPAERTAILCLRAWCEGGAARDGVAAHFRQSTSPLAAELALAAFDALVQTMLCGARRPLTRHGLDCRCFGGHECAFANLVVAAALGDRDEALLFAAGLLCAPAAEEAVELAAGLLPVLAPGYGGPACPVPCGSIH